MEIRNIITFVRIAELQNFSKAARQLGYSQSAVTMQIKQLEEELNAQLFDRIGKHIRLTQAGQRLLPHALEILDGVRRAQGITREPEEVSGRLRIGTAECPTTSAGFILRCSTRSPTAWGRCSSSGRWSPGICN